MDPLQQRIKELQDKVSGRSALSGEKASKISFSSQGFRASIDMIAAILVGTGLGLYLDSHFGSDPWLLILGFLLGSVSGLWTVYRRLT